jgi:transcriptional regulator with XRE-family HTH domain
LSEAKKHWTETDVESYVYRIAFDFVAYVSELLETGSFSQAKLAERLGVTEGRVSQILNNPGNLTLKQIVKVARALDRKVSIVTYDDDDPNNKNGPISAGVFLACWERVGKPADFFALDARFPLSGASSQRFDIPLLGDLLFGVGATGSFVLGSGESYGLTIYESIATGFGSIGEAGVATGLVPGPQAGQPILTLTDAATARPQIQIEHLVAARVARQSARSI